MKRIVYDLLRRHKSTYPSPKSKRKCEINEPRIVDIEESFRAKSVWLRKQFQIMGHSAITDIRKVVPRKDGGATDSMFAYTVAPFGMNIPLYASFCVTVCAIPIGATGRHLQREY